MYGDVISLRALQVEIDNAVTNAFGWTDLGHGFHEVDFLPEHYRVRFTISQKARKEVLRRLLKLNHERRPAELASEGKRTFQSSAKRPGGAEQKTA